ncbi:MAG: M67 family metallopeptidase [Nitrospirota bacterium]
MRQLFVPQSLLDEIISHCKEVYPNEACGILAGKEGVVQKVYKMRNIEDSPVSYMVDSKEQFAAMKEMRKEGLEMLAIYHSHPDSDAYPSPRDIKLAFYPESVYLIVSLINIEPKIKAFTIRDEKAEEVEMKTILE